MTITIQEPIREIAFPPLKMALRYKSTEFSHIGKLSLFAISDPVENASGDKIRIIAVKERKPHPSVISLLQEKSVNKTVDGKSPDMPHHETGLSIKGESRGGNILYAAIPDSLANVGELLQEFRNKGIISGLDLAHAERQLGLPSSFELEGGLGI